MSNEMCVVKEELSLRFVLNIHYFTRPVVINLFARRFLDLEEIVLHLANEFIEIPARGKGEVDAELPRTRCALSAGVLILGKIYGVDAGTPCACTHSRVRSRARFIS